MTQQHRITIEKHCALSLYSLIFFLTLFFSVPLYAQTELPAAPNWSTTNTTQSSDGVYTLRWAPVVDADFYQISEIGPKGTHDWFTFREFESFVKNEPGNYRYALRSCRGVAESPVECGFPGQSIQVTVAADVRAHHEQMPSNDELAVQNIVGATIHCPARTEQPGGPDILIPGAWHTECQPGHGWAFYWVNALRFPEGSELHRNVYELLGVWTTYRYMGGSYKPVWLYMPMRTKSDLLYDGPILYQTLAQNNHCAQGELIIGTPNKCQITAGHIRVLFRNSDNKEQDGLKIALCSIKNNILSFAGAANPLWIVRKNSNIIEELKPDKYPIGQFITNKRYKSTITHLASGDCIYMFTDGFLNQFGGPNDKKFNTSNFKKLILSIRDGSMEDQRNILKQTLNGWKGNGNQLDDICVIGMQID